MNRFVICGLIWLATVNVSMAADNDVATSEAIHNLALGKKIEPAFSNTLENAETGDPNALIALGKGFASAQAALGNLYSAGQGVPRDPVEAYKWLALAAAAGDTKASEDRLKLAESMPLQDVAEGEYRAGSFRSVTGAQAGRRSQDDSPTPKSIEAGFFITADGYFL